MDESDTANIFSQLLLLIFLTLVNAFFASAEMAAVSVNKNKIKILAENEDNKKAKLILELLEEPTKFLSTIQVAITLSGFLASASAATSFSKPLGKLLTQCGISYPYNENISLIFVTIILSYFTLVFGELVPKRIALQKAEFISLFSVKMILTISKITSPFIKLLSLSTNFVLHILGMKDEKLEEKISKEEIKSMIEAGQANGVFNETEKEMINSIFEFDDITVGEIMTARTDVFMVNIDVPVSEYIDNLLSKKYARVPVYQNTSDNIIGTLHLKDLIIEARKNGFENIDVKSIIRKPYLIPESKKIDELFKEMQKSKKSMAIIIDEYGGFAGIVTMEDLVEEVMGEIEDEHDISSPQITRIDKFTYIVNGLISLDELNEKFGTDIENHGYNTLSGYITSIIGVVPNKTYEGKELEIDKLRLKIEETKENRIEKVKVILK
ncbi:HlyC/CorC family transporter [Fusobacterium perfoetens]|uniref:hemolysin family protein n=1 Tax=Fusobacterium perfoetens TaxID=852 RepID=UPI0015A05694|nr:hemolysin family protein [Fusobacterium perfoetens]MCF2625981.1 HlyC/CorC family transporter [Fusobacterium perfoetens]